MKKSEELLDLLRRNYDRNAASCPCGYEGKKAVQVSFTRPTFTSSDLSRIFNYLKVSPTRWVFEWSIRPHGTSNVKVSIWIKDDDEVSNDVKPSFDSLKECATRFSNLINAGSVDNMGLSSYWLMLKEFWNDLKEAAGEQGVV
jgi:hypothetical protein